MLPTHLKVRIWIDDQAEQHHGQNNLPTVVLTRRSGCAKRGEWVTDITTAQTLNGTFTINSTTHRSYMWKKNKLPVPTGLAKRYCSIFFGLLYHSLSSHLLKLRIYGSPTWTNPIAQLMGTGLRLIICYVCHVRWPKPWRFILLGEYLAHLVRNHNSLLG